MVFFDANRGMSSRGLLQWVEVVEAQYLQNGQDNIILKGLMYKRGVPSGDIRFTTQSDSFNVTTEE